MGVKQDFEKAAKAVQTLSNLSNEDLLSLYGFYKQATAGDVSGPKPGMLDLKGKAKFQAWTKNKGLSQEKAMERYIALVKKLGA